MKDKTFKKYKLCFWHVDKKSEKQWQYWRQQKIRADSHVRSVWPSFHIKSARGCRSNPCSITSRKPLAIDIDVALDANEINLPPFAKVERLHKTSLRFRNVDVHILMRVTQVINASKSNTPRKPALVRRHPTELKGRQLQEEAANPAKFEATCRGGIRGKTEQE